MDALLIVDFQVDFCPGGALAVAEGDRIAGPVNALARRVGLVVATRDWHPPDHGSFAGAVVDPELWDGADPPAIWPVHCVQDTPGAQLHPALETDLVDVVVDKGLDPHSQGYSAFQHTGLADALHARGVTHLYVAGLATDYCVLNSVLDARAAGFDVTVVTDAVRGVEVTPGDSADALRRMEEAGARLAGSAAIAGAAG